MNNYKKIRLLELLKEYDREMLRQRNVRANSIWDIVQLVQPKVQKLVSKINKLPMFTKSGIKDKSLAIYPGSVTYKKTKDLDNFWFHHTLPSYNKFGFHIKNKDQGIMKKYGTILNQLQKEQQYKYYNSDHPNAPFFRLLSSILALVDTAYDWNWLIIGYSKTNQYKFVIHYMVYDPLDMGDPERDTTKLKVYDNINEFLNEVDITCNDIYQNYNKVSEIYIEENNKLIDLAKKSDKVYNMLKLFVS